MNMHELIQQCLKEDCLFHGSSRRWEVLIPKTPLYTSPNAHSENGVYASEEPLVAAFNAILDFSKVRARNGVRKIVYSWYKSGDRYRFGVTRNVIEDNAFSGGYVYVLVKSNFRALSTEGEYVAKRKISPSNVINVSQKEFLCYAKIEVLPLSYLKHSNAHTVNELCGMGYID
jgi:hypothetical protein